MGVKITVTDNTKKLLKALKDIDNRKIDVGILGSSGSEIAMIAAVHEFGAEIPVTPKMRNWFAVNGYPLKKTTTVIKIPERSFLRSAADEGAEKITRKIEETLPTVLENSVDPEVFMEAIGLEFAEMVQKKLRSLKSPGLSSMTTERKGSSNPLIDSGRLVGSVNSRVVRGG